MRAKIHMFIDTKGCTNDDKKQLNEKTRNVILNQLIAYIK